ncbi:DUF1761 domain-containing protein [Candidatus Woesearchaeota archaeon]|nr:DUF1761 domain-containing protein [Candidatus Woesearchaeota archaeon]
MVEAVSINYLAVIVAAVASMALGAFWYSPMGFGKMWMKLSGITPQATKNMKESAKKSYALGFLCALITSYVLAHFVKYTESTTVVDGMLTGFWIWFGFVATVTLGVVLWEGKSFRLYLLNNGYNLLSLLLMGMILTLWV